MESPPAPNRVLASVPLFAHLSPSALAELAELTRVHQYPQGQILCNEGDPGDHLIVLESGQLRISRFTALGDETVLSVVEPPAVLGELALLDGAPRDATVTAQRAVTVRSFRARCFSTCLSGNLWPSKGHFARWPDSFGQGTRHADFVGLDVPGRLAKWLLNHARRSQGEVVKKGTVVSLQSSQGELAAELGTTRSTLNRVLHDFEGLGLISVSGSQVTLLKPDRLLSYID